MIKLRLVGSTADLEHLIYTSRKQGRKGSHIVPVDDRLFDTLEDLVRKRRRSQKESAAAKRAAAPRVESKLSPREVQVMLRAGRSVEQVARSAAVPVAWVEQFLGPVLYERARAVQESRRAWLSKQRAGASGAPLGESVEANLRSRHVRLSNEEYEASWDASRAEGAPWSVTLRFRFRGREARALWKYDPVSKTVTAGNRLAADLGWVSPGRRLTPSRPAAAAKAEKPSRAKKAAKKRTTRKPAAKKRRPAAKKRRAVKRRPAARRRATKRRR